MVIACVVRLPFWHAAWQVPADADTAIVGLMARHWGLSATFWGQPYGSPLEAWLVAPFVVLGGGTHAIRLVYFALSLALVPVAYFLAARVGPRAAWPAALLAACPPAYLLLLASLPPPLYPSTLAMGALLLALTPGLRERIDAGGAFWRAAAWGVLAGLALWTHLTVASAALAGLVILLPALRRQRLAGTAIALGLLLASAPLWTRALADRQIFTIVRPWTDHVSWPEHAAPLLASLHVPLGSLLGAGTPVVADLEQRLHAPGAAGVPLLWATAILFGLWRARRALAGRLTLVAVGLGLLLFLVPERSEPHTVRFLALLYVPLAVIAGTAMSAGACRLLLPALLALHLAGDAQLLLAWRRADRAAAPYHTPDLSETRAFLDGHHVTRAYAGYEAAYRLTWESGERLLVSQPWNERFPGFPLPYKARVHESPLVAWILTPDIPSELPAPEAFEQELRRLGVGWRTAPAGPAVVYYGFTPPRSVQAPAAPGKHRFALAWVNGHPEAVSPEAR